MRISNPLPTSLPQESCKAARIFKSFVNPTGGMDGLIPSRLLRSAHGFAIFTVAKAGFLMSVRAGTGVVVGRLPDGRWSPPSAIGTGGMGFGGQIGAEVAEFILVLNSSSALAQFMSAGSITLGGNASVALGPIGRNAEGSGALNSKGKVAAMYSYSKTKGAFAGISVEGSAIFERQDCNVKAYGSGITATKILSGHIEPPPWAEGLLEILTSRAGNFTEYVDPTFSTRFTSEGDLGDDSLTSNINTIGPGAQSLQSRNVGCLDQDVDRPPRSNEPYVFNSSEAMKSSLPPLNSQAKKGLFKSSSWRINSRQNSGKSSLNSSSRQGTPVPHWINTIKSDSPPQEEWNPSTITNGTHLRSPHSTPIQEQVTEILDTGTHHTFHEKTPKGDDEDDEILSLSSIGSDEPDQLDSSDDWPNSKREPQIIVQTSQSHSKRNWYDPVHDPNPAQKPGIPNVKAGMIDDLMSFDQIGPPHSIDCFHSSMANFEEPTRHGTSILETGYPSNQMDFLPSSNFFESQQKPKAARNVLSSNHGSEKGDDKVPVQEEKGTDFLVGTTMPSVVRTDTNLVGYLGKVTAKFDFDGDQTGDLSFKKGDAILIIEKIDDQWWLGSIGLRRGIFPINRVSSITK